MHIAALTGSFPFVGPLASPELCSGSTIYNAIPMTSLELRSGSSDSSDPSELVGMPPLLLEPLIPIDWFITWVDDNDSFIAFATNLQVAAASPFNDEMKWVYICLVECLLRDTNLLRM